MWKSFASRAPMQFAKDVTSQQDGPARERDAGTLHPDVVTLPFWASFGLLSPKQLSLPPQRETAGASRIGCILCVKQQVRMPSRSSQSTQNCRCRGVSVASSAPF